MSNVETNTSPMFSDSLFCDNSRNNSSNRTTNHENRRDSYDSSRMDNEDQFNQNNEQNDSNEPNNVSHQHIINLFCNSSATYNDGKK